MTLTRALRNGTVAAVVALTTVACTGSDDADDAAAATEPESTGDAVVSTDEATDSTEATEPTPVGSDVDGEASAADAPVAQGPPGDPAQTVTSDDVDRALEQIPGEVEAILEASGVPGLAVSVVFEDDVVFADGFGVREVGGDEPVGPDTVFQIASLSKSLSATAVAGLVGEGDVDWDEPVVDHLPDFELSDPYVTENVTIADMFTHRSGLPPHAGDLLEDLGFDRDEIFDRLAQEPLDPFRAQHQYTNFGLTAGAESAAAAAGEPWDVVIDEQLFEPAGMTNSSALFDDYITATDRAVPHGLDAEGNFVVGEQRNPDPQTPAGGVSSTATDLANWMRLQLAEGDFNGQPVIDADALLAMQTPHSLSNPPGSPSSHSGLYGLGMGVGVGDDGFVRWSHSGAFLLGTGTNYVMVPGQQLGLSVITNGAPVGAAEAVSQSIVDLIVDGEVSRDWFAGYSALFAGLFDPDLPTDWSEVPSDPSPAGPADLYVGIYDNDYYGPMEVTQDADALVMTLGPDAMTFELEPYDGDTFLFSPPGENGTGPTGITFEVDGEQAVSVTSEFYDQSGLGTWESR